MPVKIDEYLSDMFDNFFFHQPSFLKELNSNWKIAKDNKLKSFKLLMIDKKYIND